MNPAEFPIPQTLYKSSFLFMPLLAFLVSYIAVAATKPMNTVVLYADDWRHDTLGVAGNQVVKTSVLDLLARESMLFYPQLRDHRHLRGQPRLAVHQAEDIAPWKHIVRRVQDAMGADFSVLTATMSVTSGNGITGNFLRTSSTSGVPIWAPTGSSPRRHEDPCHAEE